MKYKPGDKITLPPIALIAIVSLAKKCDFQEEIKRGYIKDFPNHCIDCGQRLDWSVE